MHPLVPQGLKNRVNGAPSHTRVTATDVHMEHDRATKHALAQFEDKDDGDMSVYSIDKDLARRSLARVINFCKTINEEAQGKK